MINPRRLLAFLAVVMALIGAAYGLRRLISARTFQIFGRLVAQVPTRDSVVALTFDDGPAIGVADTIIDVLRQRGVHATFFVTGSQLAAAPVVGAQLAQAGEELANHSYSHRRMITMRGSLLRDEIERTDSLIRQAGQRDPIYFSSSLR